MVSFAQGLNVAFDHQRHDNSLGDRIRSAIGNNLGVMSTVVNQFAGAAASAFPPCAPLSTAFNYVLMAAKAVKADYDMLSNFFSDVGSQLGNITIIRDVINSIDLKQLTDAVGSIYSAALTASAFAIKYIRKKLLIKGIQALLSGNDRELAGAYAKLSVASQKLHEVVSFVNLDVAQRNRLETRESFAHMEVVLRTGIEQVQTWRESLLEKLKKIFGASFNGFNADRQPRKLLKGSGQWLFEEDRYIYWEQATVPCLWISGSQGCGKTHLAAGAVEHLQTNFRDQKGTAVASCFFSDDHDESASVTRLLIEAVLQIARSDRCFAKSMLAGIDEESPRDWQKASVDEIWEQFYVRYYLQLSDSSMKLWLVLDGIETAGNNDNARSDLLKLFRSIKARGVSIHVLLLGQPSLDLDIMDSIPESDLLTIEVGSEEFRRHCLVC